MTMLCNLLLSKLIKASKLITFCQSYLPRCASCNLRTVFNGLGHVAPVNVLS